MPKNDVFRAYKDFDEEDKTTFRNWLRANAVIATLFIMMLVALVLSGHPKKDVHVTSSEASVVPRQAAPPATTPGNTPSGTRDQAKPTHFQFLRGWQDQQPF